jgi:hypothetical protein
MVQGMEGENAVGIWAREAEVKIASDNRERALPCVYIPASSSVVRSFGQFKAGSRSLSELIFFPQERSGYTRTLRNLSIQANQTCGGCRRPFWSDLSRPLSAPMN